MLAFAALCPLRGAWALRSIEVLVLRKYSKVCELNSRDSGWVSQIAIDFDNLNIAHAKPRGYFAKKKKMRVLMLIGSIQKYPAKRHLLNSLDTPDFPLVINPRKP
jgi:hypothetical protein